MGTVPSLPTDSSGKIIGAGHVVKAADMNAIEDCVTFLYNKPICRIHATSNQTVSTLSFPGTILNFDVADFDPDGMFNLSNPGRLTIQTPGWYRMMYSVNGGTTGTAVIDTSIIGTTGPNNPEGSGFPIGGGSSITTENAFWAGYTVNDAPGCAGGGGIFPFFLYQGDYVQVYAWSSGPNFITGAGGGTLGEGSSWSAEWVSA